MEVGRNWDDEEITWIRDGWGVQEIPGVNID
jgi:hypothetical protein